MPALPSISVVCANASTNGVGRALLLADLLRTETRVQVVGVGSKPTVWTPAARGPVPVRAFTVPVNPLDYPRAIPWFRDTVGDDFVIVSKPVVQSLGLALASGVGRRPFILDIDDWETGLIQIGGSAEGMTGLRQQVARFRSFTRFFGANRFAAARVLEAYAKHVPHRLVSNRWLEKRFGGRILYHVRDPRALDPALPPAHEVPKLPQDATWVGFVGTPRPHKGISVLVDAVRLARRDADVGLVLMGVDDDSDPVVVRARSLLGRERFITLPQFPFDALTDHLRLPDVIALPSLDVPAAWGQIPAKVFDAMAMEKPVVASALNDLPEILDGAGLLAPAGDAPAFARALVRLADDPGLRRRLGARGREKLVERYSYDVGRRVLVDEVRRASGAS